MSRAPRLVLCYRADDPDAGDVFSRIVPYGLMTIHGWLRANGFDSRLHNFTGVPFAKVRRALDEARPDAIGVSHFTFNHASCAGLYAAAAEAAPQALVIAGGPQATHLDEPILSRPAAPRVIVRGEGERPALALAEQLAAGALHFEAIPGLSWVEGGELRRTPEAPPAEDLDPFHPPERYDALHGVAAHEQFPIVITSRGCPAACTFCNTPLFWGRQMRYRSAASVVDEIELVWKRWGIDFFSLRDDTFTAKKSRVKQLADELERRGIFVLWNCQSRVNLVDEERLLWMRRAGCDQLQFGVEAASPSILKELNKEIRPDQIERALRLCRKVGIKSSAYFITGVPGQTDADLEANRRLFETAGLMDGIVAPLAYYPGTSLFDDAKARGEVDEELFLAGDQAALFVRRDPHAERQFRRMVGAIEREAPRRGFTRDEIEGHLARTERCYASLLDLGAWHEARREWDAARTAYEEIAARWPASPWGPKALARLAARRGPAAGAGGGPSSGPARRPAPTRGPKPDTRAGTEAGPYPRPETRHAGRHGGPPLPPSARPVGAALRGGPPGARMNQEVPMAHETLDFTALAWQPGGHPLERKKLGTLGGATLLRFEPGFEDPNWCVNGHAGYVLEGTLRLALDEGAVEAGAGQGFVLDPGTRHRASNPGTVPVVLFIAPRG